MSHDFSKQFLSKFIDKNLFNFMKKNKIKKINENKQ